MGVGEMLGKMSSAEITEWWAYLAIESKEREEARMLDSADRQAKEAAVRASKRPPAMREGDG